MGFWPFSSKAPSLRQAGLLNGITDWHSHILPGVDDGFKTLEDSLKALDELAKLGVQDLWLTPHIMEDCPNETKFLRERFSEFQSAYKGKIRLHLAAENMLDSLFEDRLEENDFLPLGESGKHLLVETSYFNPPMNMTRMLEHVMSAGYFPVLAHPERYRYMDELDYERLREMGVLFQANFFSLVGGYGNTARKKLEWMLKKDMIDLMGSDLHRLGPLLHLIEHSPTRKKHLEAMKAVGTKHHHL